MRIASAWTRINPDRQQGKVDGEQHTFVLDPDMQNKGTEDGSRPYAIELLVSASSLPKGMQYFTETKLIHPNLHFG